MGKSVRLFVKGVHVGYKRNRRNQHTHQSRLQLEGVQDREAANFYMGKRVAYMYKAPTTKRNAIGKESKYRCIWGKIIAPHGDNGVVRAKFRNNLPPSSIGKRVRVMLYPSNI